MVTQWEKQLNMLEDWLRNLEMKEDYKEDAVMRRGEKIQHEEQLENAEIRPTQGDNRRVEELEKRKSFRGDG